MKPVNNHDLCPCGTGKTYLDCCGAFISHQKTPSTPEELMRSRYTAYYQANMDYIAQTMKSPAADGFDANEAREWARKVQWLKLEVAKASIDLTDVSKGIVEFSAHYSAGGKKHVLHEISEFSLQDGRWYYVDGIHQ